jgi:hypothetical protein
MTKQWRRGLHVTVVSLLIGTLMVDTAAACRLFGRRSCCCYVPAVAGECQSEKALPPDQLDAPALEASPSDAPPTAEPEVAPPAVDVPAIVPPAVPPMPTAPAEVAPPAAAPAADVAPIPATPAPPAPRVAPPSEPSAPAPRTPAATPPAPTGSVTESFDDLFPPTTPAAPDSPEAPAPVPAPSPAEDDPFAPATTPVPAPPPAPAVDDDDPFAPAPAGNRTSRPAAPASPPPVADPFANPFRTSAAGGFPVREWSDDSGLFQISGRLVAIVDGKVRILKTTGRTTTVPLSRLSVADRQYVAEVTHTAESAATQVAAR